MIDLSKIEYRTVVVTEKGKQYNIENYIQNLGWEEPESEIATRISFTVRNDKTSKGALSSLIKPGCLVVIFSVAGSSNKEVARGNVMSWNPVRQSSANTLKCTCYDELHNLQKSQDNMYFPKGTGTKSAITKVFKRWGIPYSYDGPNVKHGKKKFNGQYLSDIILDLLDDAAKKGGGKYIVRASGGKACVLPRGSNKTVYVFRADNTKSVSISRSTEDLVTRVKVVGQADDDGKSKVEATLNGLTKYGIRQRIYTRGSDESISEAKKAAQEILDDKGSIKKEVTVQSPDVPFVRKGDLVYLIVGTSDSYYYVKGIRHDADSASMSMTLETAKPEKVSKNKTSEKNEYNVGDVVNFHGGTHYVSSYPGSKGYKAKAGKAKITKKNGSGKAHPWHLIHTDSASNVYGWVDDGTFD